MRLKPGYSIYNKETRNTAYKRQNNEFDCTGIRQVYARR
jgi:hypothetical protein